MEDAVEQLDRLGRSVSACTVCRELVACRKRAVPGAGHPHCSVMVVSLQPDERDEEGGLAAGATLASELAAHMPALTTSAQQVYVTTLMKCVPRTGCDRRPAEQAELDACFHFLSKELTITTPHYVLAVGEHTTRYLLGRLFTDLPYQPGDSLELRVFDNPAFRIVPVATPAELAAREPRERRAYNDKLRTLAQVMGL
jgi:uracil-DNA glycosylase family 4